MGTVIKSRIWIVFVVFASALVMSFTLIGCGGPSDEELITTAIDDEMGIVVNPSEETVAMLAEEATSGAGSTFDTMGIDSTELVTSWIDGFSYTVGTISVDGDTATAEVAVTSKQLGPIMMEWQTNFQADVQSQGFTSMDEVYSYAGQTIMERINNASPVETTVTFELTKEGDEWILDQGAANQTALMDAMIGDYSL